MSDTWPPIEIARLRNANADAERRLEDFIGAYSIIRHQLEEARALLSEAIDQYPTETDPKLWTVRVRTLLSKYESNNETLV